MCLVLVINTVFVLICYICYQGSTALHHRRVMAQAQLKTSSSGDEGFCKGRGSLVGLPALMNNSLRTSFCLLDEFPPKTHLRMMEQMDAISPATVKCFITSLDGTLK